MLAWDIPAVPGGYLVLNLVIPFYILYSHHGGRRARTRATTSPALFVSILWAVSVHRSPDGVPARALPARPHWNTALLGPRFLATASRPPEPALMIIILAVIRRYHDGAYAVY